jgi:hypothetical protein
MTTIPRGKYIGKRVGDQPKDEAEHFIRCPACQGWIDCRDLGQVFEHEGPLPPSGPGSAAMTKLPGAQFEILVDCKPRSYRDTRLAAVQAAEFLKNRNPHSEVAVKDLQSGATTMAIYKSDTK